MRDTIARRRRNFLQSGNAEVVLVFGFGAVVAGLLTFVGVRDLESYDHSVFSLTSRSGLDFVRVLGQPVYTLGLGLGVRLPLHGNLAASPVAALAPFVPLPVAYFLLIAFSVSAAAMVTRYALKPLCGGLVSWLAMVLLFWSVPMMSYTIYNDWPETAVTYCATVTCMFAPHAFLALVGVQASSTALRVAALPVVATVWAAVALAHAGYLPMLGCAVALSMAVAMGRSEYRMTTRVAAVVIVGIAALTAVVLPLTDLWREILLGRDAGTTLRRVTQGATGNLLHANMFPYGETGNRLPFTFLALGVVSLCIGLSSRDVRLRWPIIGSAIASIALGIAATAPRSESIFAPSALWAFRDPAAAFSVFSGACASRTLRHAHLLTSRFAAASMAALLLVTALQGPLYATDLFVAATRPDMTTEEPPWNHDFRSPTERLSGLGIPREAAGDRIAFWPGIREELRNTRMRITDFAHAGYVVVTASTKQRTMAGLVRPNDLLFNQTTDLPPQVLCAPAAIRFLRLRYLFLPRGVTCDTWMPLPDAPAELSVDIRVAPAAPPTVWALPVMQLTPQVAREPALSERSFLVRALVPIPATLLIIAADSLTIRLDEVSTAANHALVLPVAFDPAWRASSGRAESAGGLLALTGVAHRDVTVSFHPDALLWMRAVATILAQIMAVAGVLGLPAVRAV